VKRSVRKEMISFGSILTSFEENPIFKAPEVVLNIGSGIKSNHQINLGLSKSQIQMVSEIWDQPWTHVKIVFAHDILLK